MISIVHPDFPVCRHQYGQIRMTPCLKHEDVLKTPVHSHWGLDSVVAQGRIELPTQGFSDTSMNQVMQSKALMLSRTCLS